ncbi:MAG: ATP-binding protein [Candidatus Altiarchaeota archaeon]|nr:ATP-binding protein [Candidatus Altiarchaeota archaeon]
MPTTVADRPRKAAVVRPPAGQVAEMLLKAVEAGRSPLEFVSEPLKRLHTGKRILIIDDFEPTAKDVQSDLTRFFPASMGNAIEIESNPLNAVARMKVTKQAGRPYDAIILDLRMPGKNGDELLRDISKADLLCPVVIHSASHAKAIQCQLLPKIDELRTDEVEKRIAELGRLDAMLSDVKTPQGLKDLAKTLARKSDGVPARFVLKYGPGYSPELLSRSLEAVMVTGGETDWTGFQQAVAKFKPVLFDAGDRTEYIEELSEMTKFLAKKTRGLRRKVVAEVPDVMKTEAWRDFNKAFMEITSGNYSTEKLAEDKDDLGAARRHNLAGLFGWVGDTAKALTRSPDREGINPVFDGRSDLVKEIFSFKEMANKLAHMLYMPRCLKGETHVTDLHFFLECTRDFSRCDHRLSEEKLMIKSPEMLGQHVIEQPIMNALQAVKGRDGGKVEVVLDKRRVSELDYKSQQYFEKLGLKRDDYVAEVSVNDNGPGIAPENLERMFESGFTTRRGGTGFGLYFLKRYIGKLDGTCNVESEVGKGTRFHMYFRLAEPEK